MHAHIFISTWQRKLLITATHSPVNCTVCWQTVILLSLWMNECIYFSKSGIPTDGWKHFKSLFSAPFSVTTSRWRKKRAFKFIFKNVCQMSIPRKSQTTHKCITGKTPTHKTHISLSTDLLTNLISIGQVFIHPSKCVGKKKKNLHRLQIPTETTYIILA